MLIWNESLLYSILSILAISLLGYGPLFLYLTCRRMRIVWADSFHRWNLSYTYWGLVEKYALESYNKDIQRRRLICYWDLACSYDQGMCKRWIHGWNHVFYLRFSWSSDQRRRFMCFLMDAASSKARLLDNSILIPWNSTRYILNPMSYHQ